jgi:hypothetical protein
MTQNKEKRLTSVKILDYLEKYGPNARVLVVSHNEDTQRYFQTFPDGLFTKAKRNLSAANRRVQAIHVDGGTIKFVTLDRFARQAAMQGLSFGMIVFESIPYPSEDAHVLYQERYASAKLEVEALLRIEPKTFIESVDGYVLTEVADYRG